MMPWLSVLAVHFPSNTRAAHWSAAWVGLDTLEALDLLATGVLVHLGDERRCLAAAVTTTLLLADAWFDVSTAAPGPDHATAILMAVFLELAIAAICAVLSVRTFHAAIPLSAKRFRAAEGWRCRKIASPMRTLPLPKT